jgi:hypothetical protein
MLVYLVFMSCPFHPYPFGTTRVLALRFICKQVCKIQVSVCVGFCSSSFFVVLLLDYARTTAILDVIGILDFNFNAL